MLLAIKFVSSLSLTSKKIKIRITKKNTEQSLQAKSLPQTCFFLGFIKSTNHQPIDQMITDHLPTDPPTHRPPSQRFAESIIIIEKLDNRNMFILQNTSTAGKTYNYTSIYYQKSLLVSIKHIRRSQLYLFLNFNLYSSAYISKLLSMHRFFFSSEYKYYIVSWVNWPSKAVICSKDLNLL